MLEDSPQPSSDSAESQESKAEPEVAAEQAEPEQTEPVALPEPTLSLPELNYTSLDDIKLEAYPENMREHITAITGLAVAQRDEIRSARTSYEEAKNRMVELASVIQTEDGNNASTLVEHIDSQNMAIDLLLEEVTQTAFAAFTNNHPELTKLPANVQKEVETQFNAIGTKFNTGNVLSQMEEAYQFALYRAKWSPAKAETPPAPVKSAPAAQKHAPVVEKTSAPANVDARKQSVVADGSVATATPRRGVDEMSWDELLSRNLHLIA